MQSMQLTLMMPLTQGQSDWLATGGKYVIRQVNQVLANSTNHLLSSQHHLHLSSYTVWVLIGLYPPPGSASQAGFTMPAKLYQVR